MEEEVNKTAQEVLADMERFVMSRTLGFVYLYLAKPLIERFGMEGEKALRQGCRAFGRHRGKRWKKWHEELGLPNNLISFSTFNDMGSTQACGCFDEGMILTPEYSEFEAKQCPLHTVCKEEGFEHWGYVYCDEMHLELLRGYNPSGVLEIHENLMKGDPGCKFYIVLPQGRAVVEVDQVRINTKLAQIRENPVEYQRLMLRREGIFLGMLYHFLAQAIIGRFGQEGKAMVESSLIEMGKKRGRELKERLEKAGGELTWGKIWDHFDLAYKYAWNMKSEKSPDKKTFLATVEYCPLAEIWQELGDTGFGQLYCATQYLTMFKELNPAAEITIPVCMSTGAKTCRFEFRI